ncbi:MAG TPA: HD domain-containing phosphohydrolase [Thermomicrobiaceae bacterium]|nr:HD domain-containing phosphohydrolase [Thermomicrobiaceae bacterium]
MNARVHAAQPPGYVRTAEVISALSLAFDLALGLPAEHAARSCVIATEIGRQLGLSAETQGELYYTALLLDAGCTAFASAFSSYLMGDELVARQQLFFHRDTHDPLEVFDWLRHHLAADASLPVRTGRIMEFLLHGRERFREGFRNTCEVANRFAGRLGMPLEVQDALMYVFEEWDGKGMPAGVGGATIPVTARIAQVAFYFEVWQQLHGREQALQQARERRGKAFDPAVVDMLLTTAHRPGFWELLERETVLDAVRALEPELPYRFIREDKLLDVARLAADFADMKSRYTLGHSRRVAETAAEIAGRLPLPAEEVRAIRLAGLFHDLGMVALPAFVLEKPREALTQTEREALRLHPYHAERILARVPSLHGVAGIVGAHHERLDGSGYYRGLAGARIPLGARILAVADAFDELTHAGPGRATLDAGAAVAQLAADVGPGFDPDAFAAFLKTDAIGEHGAAAEWTRRGAPAGLTAREVEVLRLAATGLTRQQMAAALFVSERTIRSHLEHIYGKIGVSTRAAATLFAVEHDLIA